MGRRRKREMDTDWLSMEEIRGAEGQPVYSSDGEKIGKVEEIFYDEATNQPEWIGIGTGFFGTKRVLVPVQAASLDADGYRVPYTKEQVKDSPDIDSDEISESTERALYDYYRLDWSQSRSPTTYAEGAPATGEPLRDEATLTRTEEELAVGKREFEAGRVRLRKWVETEPVQADVDLKRETARVRREPVSESATGAEIGEEEVEVELRREEPVVEKRALAKERVSLEKDVETDTETISEEVRKERIEVEGDDESVKGR
jgi:uncharacterized protein (TIGR02271 family)